MSTLFPYTCFGGPGCGHVHYATTHATRHWLTEPLFVSSIEDNNTTPSYVLIDDSELGELLLDAAIAQGSNGHPGRIVHEIVLGLYVPDHRTSRLHWVDLQSRWVWQFNHRLPLNYQSLAVFCLRERALLERIPQHCGPAKDSTGLGLVSAFRHDGCLQERVRAFRRRRLIMFDSTSTDQPGSSESSLDE